MVWKINISIKVCFEKQLTICDLPFLQRGEFAKTNKKQNKQIKNSQFFCLFLIEFRVSIEDPELASLKIKALSYFLSSNFPHPSGVCKVRKYLTVNIKSTIYLGPLNAQEILSTGPKGI